jgi:hypothetical protein
MIFSNINGWDGMALWLARQIVQGHGLSSWWQPCNAGAVMRNIVAGDVARN